jgi:hypothetical protein
LKDGVVLAVAAGALVGLAGLAGVASLAADGSVVLGDWAVGGVEEAAETVTVSEAMKRAPWVFSMAAGDMARIDKSGTRASW